MTNSDLIVSPWLRRLGAASWRLVAGLLLVGVLFWLALLLWTITLPILIAMIVAATFAPYVLGLRKRGWSRTAAALTVTAIAIVVIGTALSLVILALVPSLVDIFERMIDGLKNADGALSGLVPVSPNGPLPEVAGALGASWLQEQLAAIGAVVADVAIVLLLATFLTFFFLKDGDKAWLAVAGQLSGWRQDRLADAGRDAVSRVGGYLRGTAILAATDAISDFAFLTLLGIPLAAPMSVLVFFGGFIPYIGGLITTTIIVLVTYSYGGLGDVVILLILITIMNVIQGNFLAPLIYGKTVDLHPAIVLVAMPAGGAIAGIIGLFLAIPVVAFFAAITGAMVAVLGERSARGPTGSDIVPLWLDRIGQVSWRLLAALALGAILIEVTLTLSVVVMGVILGVILAATLVPIVDRLRARDWGRSRAAIAVTGLVALVVVVVLASAVFAVAGEVVAVAQASVAAASTAESTTGVAGGTLTWLAELSAKLGGETAGAFRSFVSAISAIAVVLILAGLLTFYFLKDGDRGWQSVMGRAGGWRRERLDEAGHRAVAILGGYMRGTSAVALFDAVTLFIILTILGIPFALPLSVILFFGGFIPYIGALIASFLALMVTIQYGGTRDVAILLVYTGVLNIVQGNILAPLILGHAVKLHPAVILCAIPAGGAIAGIPGMFLAVPLLGVLAAIRQPIEDALGERAEGTAADRSVETAVGSASEDRGPSMQASPPEPAPGDASIA